MFTRTVGFILLQFLISTCAIAIDQENDAGLCVANIREHAVKQLAPSDKQESLEDIPDLDGDGYSERAVTFTSACGANDNCRYAIYTSNKDCSRYVGTIRAMALAILATKHAGHKDISTSGCRGGIGTETTYEFNGTSYQPVKEVMKENCQVQAQTTRAGPTPQSVNWTSVIPGDGQIYPSVVLALAAIQPTASTKKKTNAFGDGINYAGIEIENPSDKSVVKVEVKLGELSDVSTYQGILETAGTQYSLYPQILFNYEKLNSLSQPITINAQFTLYVNNVLIGTKYQIVRVRSVNDVPLAVFEDNGKLTDTSLLFAAFVNENNPLIDGLLREALNTRLLEQGFIGYQGTPRDVSSQVFAIWHALQKRGIKYSNITTPSGTSDKIFSQHVRFLEDSINNAQANCIDGVVLFASILRKIGIDPIIVLIPGHAFLGFYADGRHTSVMYLETTMIGLVDLYKFPDDQLTPTGFIDHVFLGTKTKSQASADNFNLARRTGDQKASSARAGLALKSPQYAIIDIDVARRVGIQPINMAYRGGYAGGIAPAEAAPAEAARASGQ